MKTFNFVLFFALNYAVTFFLAEWASDGLLTDEKTWLATNLAVAIWSTWVGLIAVERVQRDEEHAEWRRRVSAFHKPGWYQ